MITALGTVISACVLLVGAIVAVHELDHMARDRYVTVTNTLLQIWESPEFQKAQLWILYELDTNDWDEFVAKHGGRYGEEAVVMVGSFYNQIGTLTHEHLLPSPHTLLRSIGGYAIAIWEKISPLVEQARRKEISDLFGDFEWLVAAAYVTYKPDHPLSHDQQFLGRLERLAGTVGGEERPGLRLLRRWRSGARKRRVGIPSRAIFAPFAPADNVSASVREDEQTPERRVR
ncbi:MAG TPA: hypothetical protein VF221_17040 [Chloroflexota bacterium]